MLNTISLATVRLKYFFFWWNCLSLTPNWAYLIYYVLLCFTSSCFKMFIFIWKLLFAYRNCGRLSEDCVISEDNTSLNRCIFPLRELHNEYLLRIWLAVKLVIGWYIIHILLSKNYTTDTMKKKLIKFPQSWFLRDLYVREKKQAVYKCLGTSTKGQELYLYMDACFVFF